FVHVALRVNRLPGGAPETFTAGEGLRIVLVQAPTAADYDLDHVALKSIDPRATAAEYERYGFRPAGAGRVEVGGAFVELRAGLVRATERPLPNHLAVLVDSVEDRRAGAGEPGIEGASPADAAHTSGACLTGPARVRV